MPQPLSEPRRRYRRNLGGPNAKLIPESKVWCTNAKTTTNALSDSLLAVAFTRLTSFWFSLRFFILSLLVCHFSLSIRSCFFTLCFSLVCFLYVFSGYFLSFSLSLHCSYCLVLRFLSRLFCFLCAFFKTFLSFSFSSSFHCSVFCSTFLFVLCTFFVKLFILLLWFAFTTLVLV